MSIGEVLTQLRPEFPDVTISKIRFLEEQGLVEPERAASGYRKFTASDVQRLRYVLSRQRDHYLPLRIIREHLDAMDQGLDPEAYITGGKRVPRLVEQPDGSGSYPSGSRELRLSRKELLEAAQVTPAQLSALESHGLITARATTGQYDADAVVIARTAAELAAFGIEPRHLRAFRTAADREAGLVEQVVAPLRRQRDTEAAARAEETAREVAAACLRLHAALVKSALERGLS